MSKNIDYIFDEEQVLKDILEYIDSTYGQHYAKDKAIQTTEFTASNLDPAEAIGAFKFNVHKYTARFGKKNGHNIADLYKAAHYLVMLIDLYHKRINSK